MGVRKGPKVKMERRRLSELVPADYNPRQISDAALAGLSASIDRFGLVEPIVWNSRTKRVVGGHQRLRVLRARGDTETDVVVVNLSPAEEKALNVALNNPHIAGEFTDALVDLLLSIKQETPALYDVFLLAELESSLKAGASRSWASVTPVSKPFKRTLYLRAPHGRG